MKEELRIILVSEDPGSLEKLAAILRRAGISHSAVSVATLEALQAALSGAKPHVILADDSVRLSDGRPMILAIRALTQDIPVICLAEDNGAEPAVEAIRSGAVDYVLKNNLSRVIPALYRCMQIEVEKAVKRFTQDGRLASERLYHTLAESAQDMIYIIGRDDRFIYVNSFTAGHLGLRPEDIISRPREKFFPPGQALLDAHTLNRVFTSGLPLYFEHCLKPGQEEVWYSSRLSPVRDESGEITAVMGITRDVTLHKRTEQELKSSEERFRNLFDNAPTGIFYLDAEGSLRTANRTFCRMLGLPEPESGSDPCSDFGLTLFGSEIMAPFRQELERKGEVRGWEFEWVREDGRSAWLSINARQEKSDGLVFYEGTLEDVTLPRRAAKMEKATWEISKAVASTADLEDLYHHIHQVIQDLMPARNCYIALFDEAAGTVQFPYHQDEADDRPPTRKMRRGLTERVYQTGKPLLVNREQCREMIARGEIELIGEPAQDWLGIPLRVRERPIGVLAIQIYGGSYRLGEAEKEILEFVSDQIALAIERKRSELELRESELKFRMVAESAGDAIITWNEEGAVVFWNNAASVIFGYSRVEAEGRSIGSFFTGFDPLLHTRDLKPEDGSESPRPGQKVQEITGKNKSGAPVLLEIITTAWRISKGVHYTCLARDIHLRRKLEEQLRQSQKMEAIGRLAGGVAHDFNNLMTAILGFSELISFKLPSDSPIQSDLNQVRDAGERAVSLTRQLLAFSRRQIVQREILNINAVVSEMEKMLRRLIGENISLFTETARDLGWISMDRGQLDQLLLNLVVNAKEAMPDGGKLHLRTMNNEVDAGLAAEENVPPGCYVLVQVTDTGKGMDESTRTRLFEPFFTTKENPATAGLGLATVYGIVTQNGGFIRVHSTPDEGTVFSLYFPRVPHPAEAKGVQPMPETRGPVERTILLVEDDGGVRALVKDILHSMGYRVLEADNGDAALVLEKQFPEPIHLLLTDVIMPGISGAELAHRLHSVRPNVKVLFMSGYTNEAIDRHGVLQQGLNFIQKPFSTRALLDKIRLILTEE